MKFLVTGVGGQLGPDVIYHPNNEGGIAWNDLTIGIIWSQVKGKYKGSASDEGYVLDDGTGMRLSEKDQKWSEFENTVNC